MSFLDNLARGLGFPGQRHDFGCPYRLTLSPEDAATVLLVRENLAPVDRPKLTSLMAFLGRSPTGAADAELMLQSNIKVTFDTRRGGAMFQRHKRLITLS